MVQNSGFIDTFIHVHDALQSSRSSPKAIGRVAAGVEPREGPSKCEALSSNPGTAKKKKELLCIVD
jgi:hypothetical protein